VKLKLRKRVCTNEKASKEYSLALFAAISEREKLEPKREIWSERKVFKKRKVMKEITVHIFILNKFKMINAVH
jgi:hypothetical protein